MGAAEKPLPERQRRFIDEFLIDGNATAAYRRAGYEPRSDNAASASASALLRNPKVSARIAAAQQARQQRTGVTGDWVVERLAAEAVLEGEDASHSARVSALVALAKIKGMMAPKKVELDVPNPVKAEVAHGIKDDLAPYAGVFAELLEEERRVQADRPAQPVAPPEAHR